jgi:hypothetical protein
MKNPLRIILFFAVLVLLGADNLFAASFRDFMSDLRSSLFSVQGKGKLFGYTSEYAFAEIKEGNFKPGDVVIIKGMPDLGMQVPEDLYEDVAYGEVENVKGKILKISILKRFKAIPKEALVTGMKRLYVNLAGNDDISGLYPLFLKEKDLYIQDKPDEKTNIKIFFARQKDTVINYKVTGSAGRIIMVGSFTLQYEPEIPVPAKEQKEAKPEVILPVSIAFNDNNGDQWIVKNGVAVCHTCSDARSNKLNLKGRVINMFFENGRLVIWDDSGKTMLFGEKGEEKIYDGYLTQGGPFLFDPAGKNIYDAEKKQVITGDLKDISLVYYFKDGRALGRTDNKLVAMEGKKVIGELSVKEGDIVRIKGDKLYLFREVRESVPLAGDYVILVLETFDIKNLKLLKASEIKEMFAAFDVDEKNREVIYLKKDGNIKRTGL